jgi:hypothetical protein
VGSNMTRVHNRRDQTGAAPGSVLGINAKVYAARSACCAEGKGLSFRHTLISHLGLAILLIPPPFLILSLHLARVSPVLPSITAYSICLPTVIRSAMRRCTSFEIRSSVPNLLFPDSIRLVVLTPSRRQAVVSNSHSRFLANVIARTRRPLPSGCALPIQRPSFSPCLSYHACVDDRSYHSGQKGGYLW